MMDPTRLRCRSPYAAWAPECSRVRTGWPRWGAGRRDWGGPRWGAGHSVGNMRELHGDVPPGREPLSGHVPTFPEEQKAHFVYPNGDSGGIQLPPSFWSRLLSFGFTPSPPRISPGCPGTGRNQKPLTCDFPPHFSSWPSGGSASAVSGPASSTLAGAGVSSKYVGPGPDLLEGVGQGQRTHAK